MKIFDFNIHFPCNLTEDVNHNIANDNTMKLNEIIYCYNLYKNTFIKEKVIAANFMIFNQNIFFEDNLKNFIKTIKNDFKNSYITTLIDFRKQNIYKYIDKAIYEGIDSIKFHSYNQKITQENFTDIIKICKYIEERNKIICIDTSYGTSQMYNFDNMKLASYISDFITKVPIVLLHSGGSRIIEAMLLAEDKKNIFLDTSFSIVYYKNSSIIQDFAFAYKKIGTKRILYGSDSPYINLHKSITDTIEFLEYYKFSSKDIENILFYNAKNLKDFL